MIYLNPSNGALAMKITSGLENDELSFALISA